MARIRTIKPEFFTSEDIVSMSPLARLFYVSLWCESDREGRLEWKPGTFKMRYFPGDSCDVLTLANELIERGLIVLYSVDGKQYAEIPTFKEHQVINNREAESTIPERDSDASARVKEPSPRVKAEGKGKEGKERNEGVERATRIPQNFIPEIEAEAEAGIDRQVELLKFTDYWSSKSGKDATKLDWQATWRNWCRNAKPLKRSFAPVQPTDTVPSKPGIDPTLAKLNAEAALVKPPTPEMRQKLEMLKRGVLQ